MKNPVVLFRIRAEGLELEKNTRELLDRIGPMIEIEHPEVAPLLREMNEHIGRLNGLRKIQHG